MKTTGKLIYPILSSAWEAIPFENGDLFFMSVYAKHSRIRQASPILLPMIELCDGTRTVAEIAAQLNEQGYRIREETADRLIHEFAASGILVENMARDLPDWLPQEQYERFHTLLAYLERSATNEQTAFDLFRKIYTAKVGVIGLGGTGSLIAMMLASTGFRHLRLIDGDRVESDNLVRQIFYDEECLGELKAEAMKNRLQKFWSDVQVEDVARFVNSPEDAQELVARLDFVFMQGDAPRLLVNQWVNQACVDQGIPYIYSFAGQVGPMYIPGKSACFACLETYTRQEAHSEYDEILAGLQRHRTRKYPSVITGVTAASHYQFSDALAYLAGLFEPMTVNKILRLRLREEPVKMEDVPQNPDCEVCGAKAKTTT